MDVTVDRDNTRGVLGEKVIPTHRLDNQKVLQGIRLRVQMGEYSPTLVVGAAIDLDITGHSVHL